MTCTSNLINVLLLGYGFMFLFSASQTVSKLEKAIFTSIKKEDNTFEEDGYYIYPIFYGMSAMTSWLTPLIMSVIPSRFTVFIGSFTYLLYIFSYNLLNNYLLYTTVLINGIGSALLWIGAGVYLTENSDSTTISRNSGLFWTMYQCSMLFGNLFLFFQFEGKEYVDKNIRIYTMIALTIVVVIGIIFFSTLRVATEENGTAVIKTGPCNGLKLTIKLLITKNMLLLSITFCYVGLILTFYCCVYGEAIGFTIKLGNKAVKFKAMSGIFIGLGEIVGGAFFGIFTSIITKWGRIPVVITGCSLHAMAFLLIFLNLPNNSSIEATKDEAIIKTCGELAIFCSFLLGLGDSCYYTQIYSMLGAVFSEECISAFTIFRFYLSVAAIASFFYSSHVQLYWQLGILLMFSLSGTITFCVVDWFTSNIDRVSSEIIVED